MEDIKIKNIFLYNEVAITLDVTYLVIIPQVFYRVKKMHFWEKKKSLLLKKKEKAKIFLEEKS